MGAILSTKFRKNLLKTLKEAKVGNPEKIVNTKYKKAIKKETIQHLKDIIRLIENDKYDSVYDLLSFSPAGDGVRGGQGNYYIDFAFLDPDTDKNVLSDDIQDLNDVINILKN